MAGEQSTGTFTRLPGETDELRERHAARIERVVELDETARPSLPYAGIPTKPNPTYRRAEVTLSWPVSNMGPSLPNVMSTVAGNLFELKPFSGLKLLDVTFPPAFLNRYSGPQFGMGGTRQFCSVYERPVIGTIIKPSVGLSPEETANLVRSLAEAGIDFIKNDELQADGPHRLFFDRITAVMRVISESAEKTGKKVMYAATPSRDEPSSRNAYERERSALSLIAPDHPPYRFGRYPRSERISGVRGRCRCPAVRRGERNLHAEGQRLRLGASRHCTFCGRQFRIHARPGSILALHGLIGTPSEVAPAPPVDRLIVLSGSGSPVTERQIRYALANGFAGIRIDAGALQKALHHLEAGCSVVLYSALGTEHYDASLPREQLAIEMGKLLHALLLRSGVRRAVVAGGDTSSHAVRQLGLYALTFHAPLTPGAPLCDAHTEGQELHGLQLVLKGGQIGQDDFFADVLRGAVGSQSTG